MFFRACLTRRALAELVHVATGFPIALVGFAYTAVMFGAGVGLTVVFVGLPLLAAALAGATGFGRLERTRARVLLGVRVDAPAPPAFKPGFFGWFRARLADVAGWRAMLYLLVKLPLAAVTFGLAAVFWAIGLAELTYPIWFHFGGVTQVWGDILLDTWARVVGVAAIGAILVLLAPWVVRGVLLLDLLALRGLLGPTSMSRRIRHLEQTRGHAVNDSAAALRRIERDLHDGAQARLVAVALDLATAKEVLAASDATDAQAQQARELVEIAHRNAAAAITDLRDLARGIHPPALDHGLDTALATLGARSGLPVDVRVEVRDRPEPAIETIVYFCATELLANALKHSNCTQVAIEVTAPDGAVRLQVRDNGTGGARVGAVGGLSGLLERVQTVDGQLNISSPPGGPTVVTIDLPTRA